MGAHSMIRPSTLTAVSPSQLSGSPNAWQRILSLESRPSPSAMEVGNAIQGIWSLHQGKLSQR